MKLHRAIACQDKIQSLLTQERIQELNTQAMLSMHTSSKQPQKRLDDEHSFRGVMSLEEYINPLM